MLQQIYQLFSNIANQERINPSHISMLAALWILRLSAGKAESFRISRNEVMHLAGIRSSSTYHKNMRDLQRWGIIAYMPSYHPAEASTAFFLTKYHTCQLT